MDLSKLSVGDFAGLLGEKFTIQGEGVPDALEAELVETDAAGLGTPREERQRSPFSVVFRGPWEPVLPQGIYHVEHDKLGSLPIFIVPIAREDDGVRYQAVFS